MADQFALQSLDHLDDSRGWLLEVYVNLVLCIILKLQWRKDKLLCIVVRIIY